MINGFIEETKSLTEDELKLVNLFVRGFCDKIGEANAITSEEIIKKLRTTGVKITGARIRKIVNYIRVHHLVINLVATSKGYYIENDPLKLKNYIESLHQRAHAILEVANSYKLPTVKQADLF